MKKGDLVKANDGFNEGDHGLYPKPFRGSIGVIERVDKSPYGEQWDIATVKWLIKQSGHNPPPCYLNRLDLVE